MISPFTISTLSLCVLLLSACDSESTHNGPGGLTPEDASALDQSAATLDQKALQPPPELLQRQEDNPGDASNDSSAPGASQ